MSNPLMGGNRDPFVYQLGSGSQNYEGVMLLEEITFHYGYITPDIIPCMLANRTKHWTISHWLSHGDPDA